MIPDTAAQVYVLQEDAYQRDRQANAHAEPQRGERLREVRDYLWSTAKGDAGLAYVRALEDQITDALRDAFIAGWDAAREEQRR